MIIYYTVMILLTLAAAVRLWSVRNGSARISLVWFLLASAGMAAWFAIDSIGGRWSEFALSTPGRLIASLPMFACLIHLNALLNSLIPLRRTRKK